jgi:hypothetical protein
MVRSANRLRIEERIFVEVARRATTKNASHKKLALRLCLRLWSGYYKRHDSCEVLDETQVSSNYGKRLPFK